MENYAKLIHKSHTTYMPTNFPAQYYGLPDGKVYVIYPRFYEIKFQRSGLEYVLAEHLEFSYHYNEEKLILNKNGNDNSQKPVYSELVDKPDPKFKIIKVSREFNSFAEAFAQLNKKAKVQFSKKPQNFQIDSNNGKQDRLSIA